MLFFRQFLLLTAALCSTQAGVIKKRDTTPQHDFASGNLTEVQPTILTAVSSGGGGDGFNTSEVITTKLLSVGSSTGFNADTNSKELTNNEILINEAKKLLEEEDKIINTNETTNSNNQKEEKENEKDSGEEEEEVVEHDNLKDIKEIIKNLENKEENLSEISENSTEFSSNDIKEGKHEEMKEKKELEEEEEEKKEEEKKEEKKEEKDHKTDKNKSEEVVNSFENSLKSNDLMTPSPPSRILTELRTEAVTEINSEKTLLTQDENFIQHKSENQEEIFYKKEKAENNLQTARAPVARPTSTENLRNFESFTKTNSLHATTAGEEKSTQTENPQIVNQKQNALENTVEKTTVQSGTTGDAQIKVQEVLNTEENLLSHRENFIEDIKAKDSTTESPKIEGITKSNNRNKPEEFLNQIELKFLNNSGNSLRRDHDQESLTNELKMLDVSTSTTTTLAPTNDVDLNIFEGNKNQHARSMAMAEEVVTTFKPLTTYKPVVLSIKDGIEETTEKQNLSNRFSVALKEKKPKFINDNSTNAQQLNLPNNAEVWSLAAMKTLPKAYNNNSLETAQMQTQTLKENKEWPQEKEEEEEKLERTTLSNNNPTPVMSNNSEKNLLDWSQIMMDKELSTTTRNNEEYKQQENAKDFNTNLGEMEQNTSTTTLATILSFTNDDNNTVADKKVEENMNNHIELVTETTTTTTPTPTITNVMQDNNHPLNATLVLTEPNLNEKINLTLIENQNTNISINDDKPIVTTTAATGNEEEASTLAPTLTSTITTTATTSTEATAVVDMTTAVVEQNSSETTTVSTLETSKLNSPNVVIAQQQEQQQQQKQIEKNFHTNNNEIKGEEEQESSTNLPNNLRNALKENPTFNENNEFSLKSIITTTTTAVPIITTFRPTILAITPTTATTTTTIASTATISTSVLSSRLEQEIDQKGNEIQTNLSENKQLQQQSILTETKTIENNLNDVHNSTKAIETHLEEAKQYESTTTTTTTTTLETITTTTPPPTPTPTTSTELIENSTSSFNSHKTENEEENIASVTTSFKLDNIETTTTPTTERITSETTPKEENNNYETTSGSSVLSSMVDESTKEGESKKELEIETTTAATLTTKTPVVAIETQGVTTELKESSTTTTTTTTESTTDESIIEATTSHIQQESEIKTKEKDKDEADNENITEKHETLTSTAPTSVMTTSTTTQETVKTTEKTQTMATSTDQETFISLLDDTTSTTAEAIYSPPPNTLTTTPQTILSTSTITTTTTTTSTSEPLPITTKIAEIYNVIHSTTTEFIQTTTPHLNAETEEDSSSSSVSVPTSSTSDMIPLMTTTITPPTTPMIATGDIGKSLPTLTTSLMGGNSGNMYTKNTDASNETDVNVIIAITVSVIGVVALILLVGFLYIMRKRQKQTSFSRRCQPVSLDEYTIDNVSVGGSMRKSSALRSSKRTYGNLAFDDPSLRHNLMGVHELSKFVQEKLRIFEEFRDVPQITSRLDEVPPGCEDKNRYANVLPLPETRVILQRLNSDDKTEYINANYVTVDKFFKEGPKDPPNYYIACQAPLESTVEDFWRMIWEQQSRVIIQATDLIENGVEKCAEYLPPSVTLDNHSTFGDFQITLQNREVKDKYAISTLLLKHVSENATRELTHYWYKWPEVGVPAEEAPIIAMLLEARSSLISYAIEQANEDKEKSSTATLRSAEEGIVTSINGSTASPANNNSNGSSANVSCGEINGNISMVQLKKTARNQGPLTVHCSPGTGRTGTIIACDIAIRSLETPKRTVDIPQIVYYVRRGRASAVLTKEQYEFIYKVANMYAAKISNPTSYH